MSIIRAEFDRNYSEVINQSLMFEILAFSHFALINFERCLVIMSEISITA
jgi:hypothetical protein